MGFFPHVATFHGISLHVWTEASPGLTTASAEHKLKDLVRCEVFVKLDQCKKNVHRHIYIYINKKQETLGIWPIKTTNGTKQELGRV